MTTSNLFSSLSEGSGPFLSKQAFVLLAESAFLYVARLQNFAPQKKSLGLMYNLPATVNQHPPVHRPLDARYYSVLDEPRLR
jgi:hypothetical protein